MEKLHTSLTRASSKDTIMLSSSLNGTKIIVPSITSVYKDGVEEIAIPREKTLKQMNDDYVSYRQKQINNIKLNIAIKVDYLCKQFKFKSTGNHIINELIDDNIIRFQQSGISENSSVYKRALSA